MELWFILVAISLIYVIWHNIQHNPVSWVQKLAWILVTAYTGPFGLLAYWFTCRREEGKTHEESTKMTWQQGVNSEMHCLAGDATGIIFSAAIVYPFGLTNGQDLIIEYISAFIVGLFVFQALMMRPMYASYWQAVKKTFFAEAVSMNFVMLGMFPVMLILMHHIPGADNPNNTAFWFTMGMATLVGGFTAYPINYWLVKRGLKHGCMTISAKPMHHEMGSISLAAQWSWITLTFILFLFATYLVGQFVPIAF